MQFPVANHTLHRDRSGLANSPKIGGFARHLLSARREKGAQMGDFKEEEDQKNLVAAGLAVGLVLGAGVFLAALKAAIDQVNPNQPE